MSRSNQDVAKRAAMVREIHGRFPKLSDCHIGRLTGISRDMVRRHRLGLTKARLDPETERAVMAIIEKYQ